MLDGGMQDQRGTWLWRRVAALALVALVIAIGPRVAGIGEAAGTTRSGVSLTTAQVGSGLFPGSRVTVSALALNASDQPVRISRVTIDPHRGWASSRARCRVPQLEFRPQDNGGRGWVVPAATADRSGALRLRFPRAVSMGLLAEQRCQGARFAFFLVAE